MDDKRKERILKNILARDEARRNNAATLPRRVGSPDERYLVRVGYFTKQARDAVLARIRRVRTREGDRLRVKVGGKKQGRVLYVASKGAATRAVNSHYQRAMLKRLGPDRFVEANTLFRIFKRPSS